MLLLANLLSANAASLQDIQNYLNSLHNVTADFVQIDATGQQQSGKFFLSRPGKMRWQYEKPKQTLLIMNHKTLIYYDQQLDQVSYFKNQEDHLALLVSKEIDLFKMGAKLEQGKDEIYVKLPASKNTGSIKMIFSKAKMVLLGFEVVDINKNMLLVSFMNFKVATSLSSQLFELRRKNN